MFLLQEILFFERCPFTLTFFTLGWGGGIYFSKPGQHQYFSQRIYCCDKTPWPQSTWGRTCFISQCGVSPLSRECRRTQSRNWRGHGEMLLANRFLKACSACLIYSIQDHKFKGGTTQSGLDLPSVIIKQKNTPEACLEASLRGAFSQLRFRHLKWLACVNLT